VGRSWPGLPSRIGGGYSTRSRGKYGGTLTTDVAVDVEALIGTNNVAVRSAIVAAANNYFLRDTGGAQSSLKGKITTYNNIATIQQGVVPEYAEINTLTLGANVAQTPLYAVPATGAGLYRISGYVVVTRAATTSSTMPKIQIDWTDSDTNTAVGPFDLGDISTAVNPAVGTNSAGQNVITADTGTPTGTTIISARQSTNINYRTTGFASAGATSMQYAIHLRVEAL